MLHGLPPAHLAIALLVLAAMLAGGIGLAVRAMRRPKARGIRVDLVASGEAIREDRS
jgi:hypothetical protein